MYNVVSIIYGIVTSIFTGYCLTYYFDSFMERRKLLKGNVKYLVIVSYVIIDYLVDALFRTGFETKETIGKQLLLLVIVFGFAKMFYHTGMQMPLFLTITFVSLKDLSSFIATTIAMCSDKLFDLWIVLLEKGYMSADTADHMISLPAIP